jgi:CspA family cold shock protein
MTGTVKNVVATKGFGFITGDDGQDYFFHCSESAGDFESAYVKGAKVEFRTTQGKKGPRAVDVRLL